MDNALRLVSGWRQVNNYRKEVLMSNVQHILAALNCKQRETIRGLHMRYPTHELAEIVGMKHSSEWVEASQIVVQSNV